MWDVIAGSKDVEVVFRRGICGEGVGLTGSCISMVFAVVSSAFGFCSAMLRVKLFDKVSCGVETCAVIFWTGVGGGGPNAPCPLKYSYLDVGTGNSGLSAARKRKRV